MSLPPLPVPPRLVVACIFALGGWPLATAQTAPARPAAAEVVELSPFTVDTSRDTGYAAENTLAGSRLNARLRDTAGSVSVFHEGISRRPRDHRSLGPAQFHGELRDGHQCVAARPARAKPVHQRRKSPQPHDGPRPRGEPGHGLLHQYHQYGSLPRGAFRRHARRQLPPLRRRRARRRAQPIFQDRHHAPPQRQPPLRLRFVGAPPLRTRRQPRAREGPPRALARRAAPGKRRLAAVRFSGQAPRLRLGHRAPHAHRHASGDGRDRSRSGRGHQDAPRRRRDARVV
jgi:hypothetical protein